jgi:hypothetical protein
MQRKMLWRTKRLMLRLSACKVLIAGDARMAFRIFTRQHSQRRSRMSKKQVYPSNETIRKNAVQFVASFMRKFPNAYGHLDDAGIQRFVKSIDRAGRSIRDKYAAEKEAHNVQ